MRMGIKIFVGVIIFLGVLSGIFLLTAKKKPSTPAVKNPAANVQNRPVSQPTKTVRTQDTVKSDSAPIPEKSAEAKKSLTNSQWIKCSKGEITADTVLFWNVQITDNTAAGEFHGKGNLNEETAFPVQISIKPDSKIFEKIKGMLVVGKNALLRGNCVKTTDMGAVVFEAF